MSDILENLKILEDKVLSACLKANRSREEVKILLATKTVPTARILEAFGYGYNIIGENRVQELISKHQSLLSSSKSPELHFIGHLQTNKVKEIYDKVDLLHSLDRGYLLEELDKRLRVAGKRLKVLIQVNTSHEKSKYGLNPDDVLPFIEHASRFESIDIRGFMTLAELSHDKNISRRCFNKLTMIKYQAENFFQRKFPELSMGMSSDYEIAIEEGATIIRVGTAVFGSRQYPDSYYWPEGKLQS